MLRRNTRNNVTLGLPTTGQQTKRSFFQKSKNDGSAASIRLTNPMVKQWRKSDKATKVSYVLTLIFLLVMFIGYKILRYNSASIWFTCNLIDCHIQITPRGRERTTSLTIARSQLDRAETIATTYDGVYVNSSPNVKEDRRYDNRGKKYSKTSGSTKGPDLDGNYVTYALYLKDAATIAYQQTKDDKEEAEEQGQITDLAPIKRFLELTEDGSFRLVLRKFRMQQSRRRVRTMLAKIDSYIKRRRQKLVMKENMSPSVVAILMMVGGLIGFLLTILIGSFWEDDEFYERERKRAAAARQKSRSARPIPSRYEVRTSTTRRQNSKLH